MTTYREACGTHLGMQLHQVAGETPCGTCHTAETWRVLYRETVPTRPTPKPDPGLLPVTPGQAETHARELLAALDGPGDMPTPGKEAAA